MSSAGLAGSPGPHVFVESLDNMVVDQADLAHLSKSLRMRDGDPLTVSDGAGSWRPATFRLSGQLEAVGETVRVPERVNPTTVAFSLVKGQKPELVIQKLTELGIDQIVVLKAERSIVKWDESKVASAMQRWSRIAREAAMQSHRVRLPTIDALVSSEAWLSRGGSAIAHFGGRSIGSSDRSIAIGPEGGWSRKEVALAADVVSLGTTVLRAETAAIAAGTLLSAADSTSPSDRR